MGDTWHDDSLEVCHHRIHWLGLLGRRCRQTGPDCAGRALGANRILTNILVIVGGPLNYLVTPMGEFTPIQCFHPPARIQASNLSRESSPVTVKHWCHQHWAGELGTNLRTIQSLPSEKRVTNCRGVGSTRPGLHLNSVRGNSTLLGQYCPPTKTTAGPMSSVAADPSTEFSRRELRSGEQM